MECPPASPSSSWWRAQGFLECPDWTRIEAQTQHQLPFAAFTMRSLFVLQTPSPPRDFWPLHAYRSLAAIHPPAPGGSSPAWSVSSYRLTQRACGLPAVFAGVDIKVEGIKGPEFSLPHESAQDPRAASSSAPGTWFAASPQDSRRESLDRGASRSDDLW